MDAEPYGVAARGLRRYLRDVCGALGVGPEACCWELDGTPNAYVALDGRLPGYPDHDLALLWDERTGWAAALETETGDDMIILCYLGREVLAPPSAIAAFVARLRADDYPGQLEPPTQRAQIAQDGFVKRLASYLSRL